MMIHWYHHSLPAPRYYLHLEKLLHYFVLSFWIDKRQTQYSNELLLPIPLYIIIHIILVVDIFKLI